MPNKNALTVGLVQQRWYPDAQEHQQRLEAGIAEAANRQATLVCLQELSLSPYFCSRADEKPTQYIEDLESGVSVSFAREMAKKYKVYIVISLVEKGERSNCYNTAVTVSPAGELVGVTRKQHIPSGDGYNETHSFTPGLPLYPIHDVDGHIIATPTCYDQWFPELARHYGIKNTELIIYPTAIGSEPTALGFDSKPMWEVIQRSHAIANNCFVVAINRVGSETMDCGKDGEERALTFYGSSFICGPNGDILAQAPRDEDAVLVATLDPALRKLCQNLFPFLEQRRPKDYYALTDGENPKLLEKLYGANGI
ncbi:MAG: nitrilase-related carbon-nitrogen hydrolase [Legionella sp.]